VLTASAAKFVGEATFRALTRNPVVSDLFDEPEARRIAHIDLAQSADLVLVAPASANIIAKYASGLADDMLTTCLLATPASTPVLVAPAMNTVMWENPATIANITILESRGVRIVQPGSGVLACLDIGIGKLADTPEIVKAVEAILAIAQDYAGKRVLVTAGATREPLDPVRFLTNRSSGKMGYALAANAAKRGAQVTLVSGSASVAPPPDVTLVSVETAEEMCAACIELFPDADLFVGAAAVADYMPARYSGSKIKKISGDDALTLILKRTPDIAAELGKRKRAGQVTVGFAAETEDLIRNAHHKIGSKNLDLIAANDVTEEGAGFEIDTNIVTLVWPNGATESLPKLSKVETAARILDAALLLLDAETNKSG
jgi:phosphopantothenoylcysteine decarboxylase/phosphopantothenate--cysteine ligase